MTVGTNVISIVLPVSWRTKYVHTGNNFSPKVFHRHRETIKKKEGGYFAYASHM